MRFLYNNLADSATITSGATVPNFPVENLQDMRLSRAYRSTGNSDDILVDFGTAQAVDTFALGAHNISTTVTLQANTTDSWGAPPFTRTVTLQAGTSYDTFDEETYRWWRVVIPTQPHQVQIGRLALGVGFAAPAISTDVTIPRQTTTTRGFSRSRQLYVNEGVRYRGASVNFGYITDAEKTAFAQMFEYSDTQPVFVDFSELPGETPAYVAVSGSFNLAYTFMGRHWTMAFTFEEVF